MKKSRERRRAGERPAAAANEEAGERRLAAAASAPPWIRLWDGVIFPSNFGKKERHNIERAHFHILVSNCISHLHVFPSYKVGLGFMHIIFEFIH